MTAVDTLTTRFVLETGQYQSAASKATAATHAFADAQKTAQSRSQGFAAMFDDIGSAANNVLAALGPLKTVVATIFGVGAAGAAAGYGLMKQAAEFDSLRQSLVAIEGDAKTAGIALSRLREMAKAPGLGFEEAVRGYSGLRNAGLSQKFADDLIRELANANARGGGNKDTFARILEQIKQAAGKPFLSQEDLRPISDAGVPVNKILKDRFGTGDTEELKRKGIGSTEALKGLVEALSKLQRVAGGEQNEFDNLGDAIHFAAVAAGEGLNKGLLPYVTKFATAVGELEESGVIESAFSTIADNVVSLIGDGGDDATESLLPLLAGLEALSGGFRNLKNNAAGLYEWLDKISRLTPGGFIAGRLRDSRKGATDGLDLGSEYERNLETLQAQLALGRRKRERDAKNPKGKEGTEGIDSAAKTPAVTLLERIAINTGRMADQLEDAQSGGGSLASAQVAAKELSSVVGGYNRRFRRMGS